MGEANRGRRCDPPGQLGWRGGYPAIYLGNGWVITAHHVGAGDVVFGGVSHHALPESTVRLGRDGRPPDADLVVFRIEPRPDLPTLPIRPTPPKSRRCRSEELRGEPPAGEQAAGPGAATRRCAGARTVARSASTCAPGGNVTPGFAVRFDPRETRFEAQAARATRGRRLHPTESLRARRRPARDRQLPGQPPNTALYGNLSTAADLSVFGTAHSPLHPR
jgi:hypothetical protein